MPDLFMKLFPGVSQMDNIHPLIVHFPIGLLYAFFVMELLGFVLGKKELNAAATWMLYLGTIGAAAAVSAGLWAAHKVPHTEEEHAIMARHRDFGLIVLTLSVILSAWRVRVKGVFSSRARFLHLIVAFAVVTAIAFGADLGGLMVYKYGVGVKAVPVKEPMHHHGIFGDAHGEDHHPEGHQMQDMQGPNGARDTSAGD